MGSGDKFKVILPVGATVEDVAPEILKVANCLEGTPLKLIMPNGSLLEARDFLPGACEPSVISKKNTSAHHSGSNPESFIPHCSPSIADLGDCMCKMGPYVYRCL